MCGFDKRVWFRQKCSPGGVAQGVLLIPVSGVDDAENRVREQIGDEEIGGNGQNGTFKRDMMRDGMILTHARCWRQSVRQGSGGVRVRRVPWVAHATVFRL